MKGFLTSDGFYYQADTALSPSDLEVPIRPEGDYRFDLTQQSWVVDRRTKPNKPWSPYPIRNQDKEAGAVDFTNLKLNIKDVIQASFAIIGIVSAIFTVKSEIQELRSDVDALKRTVATQERQLQDHDSSETAHWKQFRDTNRRIDDLEREIAFGRRQAAPKP